MAECAHAEGRVHPSCHVELENIRTIWNVVSFKKTKQKKTTGTSHRKFSEQKQVHVGMKPEEVGHG